MLDAMIGGEFKGIERNTPKHHVEFMQVLTERTSLLRAMLEIKIFSILIIFIVTIVESQNPKFPGEKPGFCPPDQPVQICSISCSADVHCQGEGKCCPTSCGGNICTVPVSKRKPLTVKPGSCPKTPTGRWVCSSTCSTDSDCRNTKKCCRNRCGALACQAPDVESIEPVDMSYQPVSNGVPDVLEANPNLNPENPFLFARK